MRVLVTNDDGIAAPGLRVLAETLADDGHDVVVVAPAEDCSGQSAALGRLHVNGQVEFERAPVGGIEGFAVVGPPALCVMAANLRGFGTRPDVIVSGINAGANTGRAVLHSGTVGAVLTGLNFGVPGVAVSQVWGDDYQWATAATLAARMVPMIASRRPPVAVSLNVPNLSLDDLAGVVAADLDPGGSVEATMIERAVGVLELNIPERPAARQGTDVALLADGYATVTALVGPHAIKVPLADVCLRASTDLAAEARRPA